MNIGVLRRHHADILKNVRLLDEALNKNISFEHAAQIEKLLVGFFNDLEMHLTSEGKFLYPFLKRSPNIDIRERANNLENRMRIIQNAFSRYKLKWNCKESIVSDSVSFSFETRSFLSKLCKLMDKEESELFHLLERDEKKE